MKTEVIKLEAFETTAFSIIGAMLRVEQAQKKLGKYSASAASAVFDLGKLIVDKNPDLISLELYPIFEGEFRSAMAQHIEAGNVGPDYETKNKNIVSAFNKVGNAFKKGLDIVDLGSTNACADAVALINKEVAEADDRAIIEATAEKISKDKGITKEEAMERLAPSQGLSKGNISPITSSTKGKDSSKEAPILPDSNTVSTKKDSDDSKGNIDMARVKLLVDNLEDIMAVNPNQANDMLNSMIVKTESAIQAISKQLLKSAVAAG